LGKEREKRQVSLRALRATTDQTDWGHWEQVSHRPGALVPFSVTCMLGGCCVSSFTVAQWQIGHECS
jgi:hypothetical protein